MHEQGPLFGLEEKNTGYWFLMKARPFVLKLGYVFFVPTVTKIKDISSRLYFHIY